MPFSKILNHVLKNFFIKTFIFWKKKDFLYFFLEREEGREKKREKERERNIDVWEIHWSVASCKQLGTWPISQACALTGNQTSDPSVLRPALNPLSHTSQGSNFILNGYNLKQHQSCKCKITTEIWNIFILGRIFLLMHLLLKLLRVLYGHSIT